MLEAAVVYRAVYNRLVRHDEAGLRECELSRAEWKIAEELRDVLKVRANSYPPHSSLSLSLADLFRCNLFFLYEKRVPSIDSYPGYGPYRDFACFKHRQRRVLNVDQQGLRIRPEDSKSLLFADRRLINLPNRNG